MSGPWGSAGEQAEGTRWIELQSVNEICEEARGRRRRNCLEIDLEIASNGRVVVAEGDYVMLGPMVTSPEREWAGTAGDMTLAGDREAEAGREERKRQAWFRGSDSTASHAASMSASNL